MGEIILNAVLLPIMSAIITAVVIPALVRWLNSKTNNQNLQMAILDIGETVKTAVAHVEQTFVKGLKEDDPTGSYWNQDAQKEALRTATNLVLDGLTLSTTKLLAKEGVNIEDMIIRRIEAEVIRRKNN